MWFAPGRLPNHSPSWGHAMNDVFREVKARIRRVDAILTSVGGTDHVELAQALSRVQRLARKGDRSREPSPELLSLLERAEALARGA